MLLFLGIVFLLIFLLSEGWTVGLSALSLAVFIFVKDFNFPELKTITIFITLLAVPTSVYLAGLILDHFSYVNGRMIRTAMLGGAMLLLFSSDDAWNFFHAAVLADDIQSLTWFAALINYVASCACLTALGIMLVICLIEVPFQIYCSFSGSDVKIPFAALRPLAICFLITFSLNAISNLYIDEFVSSDVLLQSVNTGVKR